MNPERGVEEAREWARRVLPTRALKREVAPYVKEEFRKRGVTNTQ